MQSLFNFIVQPKNKRYENEVDINGKKLIINTTMDDHKYVSRIGIVKSIPRVGETNIKVGDEVIVHHNVFRRFYNMKGEEKNSSSYFKEDLYFCYYDQIFLYKQNNKWKYQGDSRYEKIYEKMQLLGIQDVTTERQHKNGTIVWKLPIKNEWGGKLIEVASFSTGYVRNQNSGYSNYQLNKRCEGEPEYFELPNGDYRKFSTRSCKLIPIEID